MIKKNILITIMISFSFSLFCCGQTDNTDIMQRGEIIRSFIENKNNVVIHYKKSAIPNSIKNELSKLDEQKFRIVNPSKKYRKSDVVRNPLLPNKQLIFVANYCDYWVLLYRQGGRGLQTHCILAKIRDKELLYIENLLVSIKVEDFEQLIDKLKESSFR